MMLKLTPKRLTANRTNAPKGGDAFATKMAKIYLANPSYCTQCNNQLPQSKKHNKFCSRSCAATFNNTVSPKRKKAIKLPKSPKEPKYKTEEERREAARRIRNEASANYRAKLRNQTPVWVDRRAIKEFYANCPSGYEVDHIIPISKGGLHDLPNLQYLTITENRRKSNKLGGPGRVRTDKALSRLDYESRASHQ